MPRIRGVKCKRYCVVYRTGCQERFSWHRSHGGKIEEARELRDALTKVAIHALIEDYDRSVSLGLPETFEPEDRK